MIRPSKKVALALEAVVDIAYHGTSEPVQSQDIGRRLNLPRRYLEQVMQQLVKAGILRGVRGPRGGYRLARERRRISVADIVHVVEAAETEPPAVSTSDLGERVMAPFWAEHARAMLARLDATTIEDLCHTAEKAALRREIDDGIDFTI